MSWQRFEKWKRQEEESELCLQGEACQLNLSTANYSEESAGSPVQSVHGLASQSEQLGTVTNGT